jgi:hypothetical protein
VKAATKTITVPNDYPTIQEAIGKATAGDTILVKIGTYNYLPYAGLEGIVIDKTISLIGEDSQKTIIQPLHIGVHYTARSAIAHQLDNVAISSFTIHEVVYNISFLSIPSLLLQNVSTR